MQPGSTVSLTGKGWVPEGFTYIQFYGKKTPAEMFTGNWIQLFNTDSAFFRAEGGSALAFNGGIQTGRNFEHLHTLNSCSYDGLHTHSYATNAVHDSHSHSVSLGGYYNMQDDEGSGVFYTLSFPPSSFGYSAYDTWSSTISSSIGALAGIGAATSSHTHASSSSDGHSSAHSHSLTISNSGGTEFRPENYTVRIWIKDSE